MSSINDILGFKSIDLTPFEIRGAKSGINNARTTGPVYTLGQFLPANSDATGTGSLSSITDGSVVTNFLFGSPYSSTLNASSLRLNDSITIDGNSFTIKKIPDSSSFILDRNSPLDGNYALSFNLDKREYVVEPDVIKNTRTGHATFISDSSVVTSAASFIDLVPGDFIKSGNYQNYYKIGTVLSSSNLFLTSPFKGASYIGGDYTSKKYTIGQTDVQYSSSDIAYDNMSAKWKYSSITKDEIPTSTDSSPLADGISLRFTHTLSSTAPDIMDVGTVVNKTLARKTQYDMPQFGIPVVPYPETMTLVINDSTKDQFPYGSQDYVLMYSQSPLYEPPPPPDKRQVANIMFLKRLNDIQDSTNNTSSGQFQFSDGSGNTITGIMPGSEQISAGGNPLVPYKDYVLEQNTGIVTNITSTLNEPIVKYVASNYSNYIDLGFITYLNGVKQNVSFPAAASDDIYFQPFSGRFKPKTQDHPGPNDVYEVHYMVASLSSVTENIQASVGQTILKTQSFPIKQGSIFLSSGDTFLSEGSDFIISYLTGAITLTVPAVNTSFTITYTPLSKQVNTITYSDSTSYCTVYDSRVGGSNADTYEFSIVNKSLNMTKVTILRLYNENKDADYDLTGLTSTTNSFRIQKSSINTSIGIEKNDVITIDYKFPSETVEYAPVEINYCNLTADTSSFYLEGVNITPSIYSGSIIDLVSSDSATQYLFAIDSFSFDGYGTKVTLTTNIPVDMINPTLYISDASVSFGPQYNPSPIISGSSEITFQGPIGNGFRPGSILKVDTDYYRIFNASYNATTNETSVSVTPQALRDYTSSAILSTVKISDLPVYLEGDTEVFPSMPIVTLFNQPALIINTTNNDVLSLNSDATALSIDGTSFLYSTYPDISLLKSAIGTSFPDTTSTTYVPWWQSNKIIPISNGSIFSGSNTVLYANNVLRYGPVDTTDFTVSGGGSVILTNPLQKLDRYYLGYMGQTYRGDQQIKYSFSYFINLPAKSKVVASFQFDNLDQFYIQVMDQKDFFENVTVPRMQEEAYQLNGNIGQGGEIPGDTGQQNSEGGLSGDEFRRQDAEIECRVFKNIYDFFQDRLNSYGVEMEAAVGVKLFNNDSTFSEDQQLAGNKSVNRIFSKPDYTNMEPQRCNPITGYFFDTGAIFKKGETGVSGVGTQWLSQLAPTGFIGLPDSTKRYGVTVNSDSSLTISPAFIERSTANVVSGEAYTGSTTFPIYDDDGYLGPKLIGTKSSNFNLVSGDTFECTLDGSDCKYTFMDPDTTGFQTFFSGISMPSVLISSFLNTLPPPVSALNAAQIAQQLTSNIPSLKATVEAVIDPTQNYGYRSTMVFRVADGTNFLSLPDSTVIEKLGFTGDTTSIGNLDRTSHSPEIYWDTTEILNIDGERSALNNMFLSSNKLDRTNYLTDASSFIKNEIEAIYEEIPKIEAQISATRQLIEETTIGPSYYDSTMALYNATAALSDASIALFYDWSYETMGWTWPIDFQQRSQTVTDIDGASYFDLVVSNPNDERILNTGSYTPVVTFTNDGSIVNGTWTGWDPSPSVGNQYSTYNQATFTMVDTPLFQLNTDTPVTNATYYTGYDNLTLLWQKGSTNYSSVFYYDNSSIQDIKAAINLTGDITASGSSIYDSSRAQSFRQTSGYINLTPDATIYRGLRDCNVAFQTISDRLLKERFYYTGDRSDYLSGTRIPYLAQREQQIVIDMGSEEILRTSTGDPGDLYTWANNRFNRRQGCYARLKQIEQMIASNQSALSINKSFMP